MKKYQVFMSDGKYWCSFTVKAENEKKAISLAERKAFENYSKKFRAFRVFED